jgi:hypothetical protein
MIEELSAILRLRACETFGKAGRKGSKTMVHQVSFWLALLILAIPDTTSSPQ